MAEILKNVKTPENIVDILKVFALESAEPDFDDPVVLRPAWCWDCPSCSSLNYEEVWFYEGSPEDMAEVREVNKIPTDMAIVVYPKVVRCKYCGFGYGVDDSNDIMDTDIDDSPYE